VVFILVFIYFIYYFFYSNAFQITDVKIEGREDISEYAIRNIINEQMSDSRFFVFSQGNLLAFNKSKAKKNIKKSYVLDELQINKDFPHTLTIKIKEKVSTVVWVSGGEEEKKYYYIDLDGVVLGEISTEEVERLFSGKKINVEAQENVVDVANLENEAERGESGAVLDETPATFPIIYDLSNSDTNVKDQILDPKTINFIIDLALKWPEVLPEKKIEHFAAPEPGNTRVNVVTEEDWSAYFESGKDLDKQLSNLKLVLSEKIKDPTKINYIDLRFEDRIYYK